MEELERRIRESATAWHSVMLAVAKLEEAGGRVEDLPAAAEEWVATHLGCARRKLSRRLFSTRGSRYIIAAYAATLQIPLCAQYAETTRATAQPSALWRIPATL